MSMVVNWGRRGLRVVPWLLLAWLASCGGTSQIEPFQPRKLIFVGDETVGLLPDGRRYGINGVDTTGAIDCALQPIWSQQISSNFGFGVDNCKAGTPSVTRAVAGGKVADLDAQITAQIATGVTNKDLFVVMIGMNDIIERYEAGAACDDSVLADRGRTAAAQISRILAAGGRAIVSTVHDLGLTPYALSRNASSLLTCLTATYNARLRVDIRPQDGRLWGLVLADDNTVAITRAPGNFSVGNVTDAACTVAPPDCTTATLVAGANGSAFTYLWADDRHFTQAMHNLLASQAIARAGNSPF